MKGSWRTSVLALLVVIAIPVLSDAAAAQEAPPLIYGVQIEQFEHRLSNDNDFWAWDGDAILGRDEWKLRLQSEGEYDRDAKRFETLENQLLVQYMVSDFFNAKAGVRFDTPRGSDRTFAVLGLQGLAQQWFEVDLDLFVSDRGDLSARLDLDYELLITNRLILTPTVEIDVAASDDRAVGVAAGLVSSEVGLRLSYDLIDRALAPYVGVLYEQKYGQSAKLARADGEHAEEVYLVAGIKLLF
jgi:copper resistance protein B